MATEAKFKITASDKTKAAMGSVKKSLSEVSSRVLSLKTGIGALVGAVGFGALIKHSFDVNDSLAKVADSVNMTTQELGGLRYAAQLGGVEVGQMDKAIQRMERSVGDARRGLTTTSDAFKALGLDINKLATMGAYQQFLAIAEGLKQIKSRADQATAAANIFGREGVQLLNILDKGKGGIQAMATEAMRLGIAINRVDAAKIEAANDALTRAWAAVRGVANTITIALAPYIKAVGDYLADAAKRSGGFKTEILDAVRSVTVGIAYLADEVRGLQVAFQFVKTGVIAAFGMVLEVVNNVTKGVITFVNQIRTAVGMEALPAFTELDAKVQHLRQSFAQNNAELKKLASEGLPTEKVKAFFDDIQKRANKAAQAVANLNVHRPPPPGPGTGLSENEKANLKKKYDALSLSLMSENDRLKLHYREQVDIMQKAYSAGIIPTQQAYQNRMMQLQSQYETQMNAIKYKGLSDAQRLLAAFKAGEYNIVASTGLKMLQGVAGTNKALFKITQDAALGQTIIQGALAAQSSLANNGGVPFGIPAMLVSIAKTAANVATIKSQSFGGGGSMPSGGGGGGGGAIPSMPSAGYGNPPSLSDQQPKKVERTAYIQIDGNGLMTTDAMRNLLRELDKTAADMGGLDHIVLSS